MSQEPPKMEDLLTRGQRFRKTLKRFAFRGTLFYMGYSILLLWWPKQRGYNYRLGIKGDNDVIVSAHRCGSYDGLENTAATAVHAITKSKPRFLHVDVRSTKDHVPILVHDDDLSRPCHQGRFTEEFNFKDLPKVVTQEIDIPFMANADGSPTFYKVKNMDSKKIESLEQLLKALNTTDDPENRTWLHIEFKGKDEEMIREAHRLLQEYKRANRTFWGHVDDDMSMRLKKIDYNMPRVASPGEVHTMFIKYWLFAYPYIAREVHYKAVWFPYVNESFKANLRQQYGSSKYKNVGDGDNWKYRLRLKLLEFMTMTSGPLFRHLHKCGILVMIGVPNSIEDYEDCLKKFNGTADCIMTDRPGLAREFLEQRASKLEKITEEQPSRK